MKEFVNYINKIKAEDELKDKTINEIRFKGSRKDDKHIRRGFMFKRLAATMAAIITVAILAFGGASIYAKPIGYISVDINPSVELGLNFLGRVVSSNGINDDGKGLLEKLQLKNMSVEDAVECIVMEAEKEGFLNSDGSGVVALTAAAHDEEFAAGIKERVKDRIRERVNEEEMNCVIYTDTIGSQIRTEAQEYGISPGKYRLIQILQILDGSITVEQYRNSSVRDIITDASDLFGNSIRENQELKELEQTRKMITDAAIQIRIRNQNQNQVQNENPDTGVKEQEQIQEQTQTQTQTQNQYQNQSQNQVQDTQTESLQLQVQVQSKEQLQNQYK